MGGVTSLLCTVIGFAYPIYASYKAIESEDSEDDTQWLTYWIVYSIFSVVESFTDTLMFWIPFYYELKLLFLIALQLPQFKLSARLYNSYIRPIYLNHASKLDTVIKSALETMKPEQEEPPSPFSRKRE